MEYYKWHAFAVIAGILFIFFLVRDIVVANKPSYLYTVMINYDSLTTSDILEKEFVDYAGIDTDTYNLSIDTTMYISQKENRQQSYIDEQRIFAMLAAKDIDLLIMNEEIYEIYANNETFYDLSEWIPQDQLTLLEDKIYSVTYSDGTTHAIGIDITDSPFIQHCQGYDYLNYQEENTKVLIGFAGNSENPEHSLEFLNYILHGTFM